MTGPRLLALLRQLGFRVRRDGARLLVAPPPGRPFHADDAATIRAHKAALLAALIEEESWPEDPPDLC